MLSDLLTFAIAAGVLVLIPGLDTALVLRSSLADSRAAAYATALGIVSGLLFWATFVAVGLNPIITRWGQSLTVLRIGAFLYLSYVAFNLIRDAINPHIPVAQSMDASGAGKIRASYVRGFMCNALNPKAAVFYITMLPQFYPEGLSPLIGGLLLAGIHGLESILYFAVLITAASRLQNWFSKPKNLRGLDLVVAMILLGFAIHLALTPIG